MVERIKGQERVRHFAQAYLRLNPDPIPRLLLLRDVLHRDLADQELCDAKYAALQSKWVIQLAAEQNDNGGWSRFHSMNSKVRHKIPTTEYAVLKAISLGLDQGDAILAMAKSYCEGLLNGAIAWPEDEGKEPNDRWPTGEEMFISAILAMIDPQNTLLKNVIEKWCHIAEAAFATGTYDPEAEWRAHCQLTGATTMRNSYLVLNNMYALTILGSAADKLKPQTEQALLDWVCQYPRGVGYLNVPIHTSIPNLQSRSTGLWFTTHWILSRFRAWRERIKPDVDTLWSMQSPDGLWDFGAKVGMYNFHLSESWRKPKNRLIDQSLRILLLMERYYGEGK